MDFPRVSVEKFREQRIAIQGHVFSVFTHEKSLQIETLHRIKGHIRNMNVLLRKYGQTIDGDLQGIHIKQRLLSFPTDMTTLIDYLLFFHNVSICMQETATLTIVDPNIQKQFKDHYVDFLMNVIMPLDDLFEESANADLNSLYKNIKGCSRKPFKEGSVSIETYKYHYEKMIEQSTVSRDKTIEGVEQKFDFNAFLDDINKTIKVGLQVTDNLQFESRFQGMLTALPEEDLDIEKYLCANYADAMQRALTSVPRNLDELERYQTFISNLKSYVQFKVDATTENAPHIATNLNQLLLDLNHLDASLGFCLKRCNTEACPMAVRIIKEVFKDRKRTFDLAFFDGDYVQHTKGQQAAFLSQGDAQEQTHLQGVAQEQTHSKEKATPHSEPLDLEQIKAKCKTHAIDMGGDIIKKPFDPYLLSWHHGVSLGMGTCVGVVTWVLLLALPSAGLAPIFSLAIGVATYSVANMVMYSRFKSVNAHNSTVSDACSEKVQYLARPVGSDQGVVSKQVWVPLKFRDHGCGNSDDKGYKGCISLGVCMYR